MSGPLVDETFQAEMTRRQKSAAEVLVEDIRSVMLTPAGRRFVWWLIDDLAAVDTFGGDPHTLAVADGRRSVGLMLRQHLQRAALEAYALMVKERMQDIAQQKPAPRAATED